MSKGTWILVIILVVLIIVFGTLYLLSRPTYGNDKAGIEKAIEENDASGGVISIIDILDMGGSRYAGFMEGENIIGLAIFTSDGRGNYEYERIERVEGKSVATFYDPFNVDVDGTHGADIIVSKNPLLAKVVRLLDGVPEQEVPVTTGGATLIGIELHHEQVALNVVVECYDASGNLLNPPD